MVTIDHHLTVVHKPEHASGKYMHLFTEFLFVGHGSFNNLAFELFARLRIFVFARLKLWLGSTQCDAIEDAISCTVLLNPAGELPRGLPCAVTLTILAALTFVSLTVFQRSAFLESENDGP